MKIAACVWSLLSVFVGSMIPEALAFETIYLTLTVTSFSKQFTLKHNKADTVIFDPPEKADQFNIPLNSANPPPFVSIAIFVYFVS